MTSITRSGRALKHEGSSNIKNASAPAKVNTTRNVANNNNNNNNNNIRDAKTMTSSGAVATDSYNLRRSARETLTKKTSNLISKELEKADNQLQATPNKKRSGSPLRRSERIEKSGVSSSPNMKKSNEITTPPLKKKKLDDVNENKDKKLHAESNGRSIKKKIYYPHKYYKALLSANNDESSGSDGDTNIKDDSLSKVNSANSASSSSKKIHEGSESSSRREDKICGENTIDNSKKIDNGSGSFPREPDIQKKSAHSSGKGKYEGKPPNSMFSESSSTSQSHKEIKGVDNTHGIQKLDAEELNITGKSLVIDTSVKQGANFKGLNIMKTNADHDSSLETGSIEICIPEVSKVDMTSSLPSGTASEDSKRCSTCSKLERVFPVSEDLELCTCYPKWDHDLTSSAIKAQASSSGNILKGNGMSEAREPSFGSEKRTLGDYNDICNSEENHKIASQNESLAAVQTDVDTSVCAVCKHPGNLLLCGGKGCRQSYHLSCLNPPLNNIPFGVWLCHICGKKKVELGVYSVSQGIESIWDVKEEAEKGKLYFVKYEALAHIHNRWVPESQLLVEVPVLVEKFNKKHQKGKETRWKQEWTEPQRILQKKLLMPKNIAEGEKLLFCYHEWLVKWKYLGYENATWELEKEPFLRTSCGKKLIKDFENRHKEAKKTSDPWRIDKVLQAKKRSIHRLSSGLDNDQLIVVNQLREFWHKSENAVLNVDQDRIIKSILFISSLKPYACRPFLVISTVQSLSTWEAEFTRLAPSINVIVYTGNKDVRKLIRNLEFYEDGGCIMFQVLLSHPNAIIEDFDALDVIGWEALIVDECQNPRVFKHFEQFKNISTEFRLLLLSSQLKDNVAEYLNLLSFLESGGKANDPVSIDDAGSHLSIVKEKLTRHLVEHGRKTRLSKFVEYWVPVLLSNVQLEQYCFTLVTNSLILQSSSKTDLVGALRDVLISTRKCCDYPYLVSQSLPNSLTKDLPLDKYLDVGVKASSKLHLLDRFLHEIKMQELRVLILYQSIGVGRDSIGDILNHFLSQRFGPDSFEQVETGLIMSEKLAALNKFNDNANGRFVFLLENRACLPSIKLSSVDVVVIFDSDWNPLNDLRALQKIRIDSQFEYINVFRLYASCTLEEKVLIFTKQDTVLDSHILSLSPSNSHLLLSWGASHLFNQLDELSQHNLHEYSENSIDKCFFNETTSKFIDDVVVELVNQLPGKAENNTSEPAFITRAQQSGSTYSRNIRLIGEKNGISSLDKDPAIFWSNISEKRHTKWRYITIEPSERIHKKVQPFRTSLKVPEIENESRKKRRKLTNEASSDTKKLDDIDLSKPDLISSMIVPVSPCCITTKEPVTHGSQSNVRSECIPSADGNENHVICNLQSPSISEDVLELPKSHIAECEGRRNAQRTLFFRLKPELSELCDTLKFPDNVKSLAHRMLEYTMNSHHVGQDPETILQAFKLSLCWKAASFMKHKLDHKECLALAKKYLNYTCNEEETCSVYKKLRMSKTNISQVSSSKNDNEPSSMENQSSASRDAGSAQKTKEVPNDHGSQESKEISTLQHEIESNYLENNLPALKAAEVAQEVIEFSNDNRSSESKEASASRHENGLKLFKNLSEPRKVDFDQDTKKVDHRSPADEGISSSRLENEPKSFENQPTTFIKADVAQETREVSNVASEQNLWSLKDVLLKKRVDLIDMLSSKREEFLFQRQQAELSSFDVESEKEKIRMKNAHDTHLELICSTHADRAIRNEKIKLLNLDFVKKKAEFDRHMLSEHKKLIIMHENATKKEREIRYTWLEEAKAGTLDESFDTLPLTESGFILEKFKEIADQTDACGQISNRCITTEVPNMSVVNSEKCSEVPSTLSNGASIEIPKPVEPILGSTSNLISSTIIEVKHNEPFNAHVEVPGSTVVQVEPVKQNKSCAEVLKSASYLIPSTQLEAEPIERIETCAEIPESTSDLMPPTQIEAEPIEQNKRNVEIPKSTSDPIIQVEAEPIEQNKTSAEIPESTSNPIPSAIAEEEAIKPNNKHTENPVLTSHLSPSIEAEVGFIDRNKTCDIPGLASEKMLEVEPVDRTRAEIPDQVSDLACEDTGASPSVEPIETFRAISETVPSIETNETCGNIPAILSAINGGISHDCEALISETEVLNLRPLQPDETDNITEPVNIAEVECIEPNEISTEILALEQTFSPKETETLVSDFSDLVQNEFIDSRIPCLKEVGVSRETETLPSHFTMKSTEEETEAMNERDIFEGEDFIDGTELRSSRPQIDEGLPSISHISSKYTIENTVLSDLVSSENNQAAPDVSSANLVNSQGELNVDNLVPENAQASSTQSLRIEGELHTVETQICVSPENANTEHFIGLVPQPILHLPPPPETVGICSSNSQNEPAQQPIENAFVQVDQSNEPASKTVVGTSSSISNANAEESNELARQTTLHLHIPSEAVVICSSNSQSELPARRPNVNASLQVDQGNEPASQYTASTSNANVEDSSELSPQPILLLPPPSETVANSQTELAAQPIVNASMRVDQSDGPASEFAVGIPPSILNANAEESYELASQPILLLPTASETIGTGSSNSQSELPARQPIVNESMHVDQSNEPTSQSIEHPPLLSMNPLTETTTHAEGNASTCTLQEPRSHVLQLLPIASLIHPQALHPDPLQNELTRIHKQVEILTKKHEDKKLQLKLECEQELEKVRKKYEALLQEDESGFNQDKKILDTIYNKVLINQILAEEFRSKFIDSKGGASTSVQGRSMGSTPQFHRMPQTQRPVVPTLRPSSNSNSFRATHSSNRPIAMPARAYSTLPSSSGPASSTPPPGPVRTTTSIIPTSTNFRSQFNPRQNIQGGNDARAPAPAPRAPAPHLHRFRPQTSSMIAPTLPPLHRQTSSSQHPGATLGTLIQTPRIPISTHMEAGPSVCNSVPLNSVLLNPPVDIASTVVATMPAASQGSTPDMVNLQQVDVVLPPYGSIRYNPPINVSENIWNAAGDVVCLSDDE